MKPLLKAPDVAEILNIPRSRVYALAKAGVIPHLRIAGVVRFDPDAIEHMLESSRVGA